MVDLRTVAKVAVVGGIGYVAFRVFQDGFATSDTVTPDVLGMISAPVDLSGSSSIAPTGSVIEDYLQAQGLTPDQASGVAAGIQAESGSNPNAVNPTSGAFGIGQWLGARQQALFARYGSNPSLQDQLDFLVSELNGGDVGGKAVLAQSSPLDTLTAYITKFMRPAPGAQTTGDLSRGAAYLG